MQRKLARNRMIAVGRKPAMGRQIIGFINDNKIHVVLDTNVPINAIWALSKGMAATQTEKDCLTILNTINKKKIIIAINGKLYKEYQNKANEHLKTGKIKPEDVNFILKVLTDNHVAIRLLVDPQKVSRDIDDDILFDGLTADYLISDNLKGVKPERLLPGRKTPYANTLSPSNFVDLLIIRKITNR